MSETQKIRIKVLIDATGKYCGYGWNDAKGRDIDDVLYDCVDGSSAKEYWLEAEIPIPNGAIPTIETTITEASGN